MAPNGTNASNLITMVTSYPEALGKGGGGGTFSMEENKGQFLFLHQDQNFTLFAGQGFSQCFFPIVPYPRVPMVLQMDGSSQMLFLLGTCTNIFSTTILFTHVMIHEKAMYMYNNSLLV